MEDINNLLTLKTVNDLSEYSFFIPAYQRGYRWSSKQVIDLLNDINDFEPRFTENNSNEKTWYCLQPIVIKKREQDSYEVIDGQQRLTTIKLILTYLNQDIVEQRRERVFEISYETRNESKIFINSLINEYNPKINNSNIDYYHISNAFLEISNWFYSKKKENNNFDKGLFKSKFNTGSKVIWYESFENNPINIFTRINIGKIPLTNSELIKALFLNSSNFDHQESNRLRLRQLEIASEWDKIEEELQDDDLWYFLSSEHREFNRIEFIFDLMNESEDKSDPYSTFRFFNAKFNFNQTNRDLSENWSEVKTYYQRFKEWYGERTIYHKIGYLIAVNYIDMKTLYEESKDKRKSDFKVYLDSIITQSLKNIDIDSLQYGSSSENDKIKKLLLLYNILTMLNNNSDNSRFPFRIYKDKSWDIEHITSVTDVIPSKADHTQWLTDASHFIEDEQLKKDVEVFSLEESPDIRFEDIFKRVVTHFNQHLTEDLNDLWNLSLLDSSINRSYKNAVFPLKRKIIIDKDKNGDFIPIGTKNVFLKYFNEYPPKISFWTQDDRNKYETDILTTLEPYI